MTFNHHNYNTEYVVNAREKGDPINDAEEKYGVRIVEAPNVTQGEVYWRVIGIHHLFPRENFSKHHTYIEALDESGQRLKNPFPWAGWTWVGRQAHERADPLALDKPDYETAGNIAMHFGQTVSIWIKGLNRDSTDKSDKVENLHTLHPDEPLADGSLLNTLGHHSFYIVYQRTRKDTTPPATDGVITGRIERGQGRTVQLLKNDRVVAVQNITGDLAFGFHNLIYGVYKLQVVDTNISQDNIRIDADNKTATINLALPAPTSSVIFGQILNGQGKTLLLIKEGNIIARLNLPETGQFNFIRLAAGVYALQVFDTNIRQDNVSVDGANQREINLIVPVEGEQPVEKTIAHYVLLGPPDSRGRQTNLFLAFNYLLTFSVTLGFSITEAKQAQRVTIIGEGISEVDQEAIRNSGSQLEILSGDAYEIEAELRSRVSIGRASSKG